MDHRMVRVSGRELVAAVGCTALALVPWAMQGRPNAYSVVAGTLVAGLLLGIRAVGLVLIVCVAVAIGVFVDLQVAPAPPSNGGEGDGRWLFVYFCLTAFPVVLSVIAAAGALVRWLVRWARGTATPVTSPRLQAAIGLAALAVLLAAASWSSGGFVLLLGLPLVAWLALRRRPDERPSAQ
jgi:hypothetical protein